MKMLRNRENFRFVLNEFVPVSKYIGLPFAKSEYDLKGQLLFIYNSCTVNCLFSLMVHQLEVEM